MKRASNDNLQNEVKNSKLDMSSKPDHVGLKLMSYDETGEESKDQNDVNSEKLSSNKEIGPVPISLNKVTRHSPGEQAMMAAYVQAGKRIPRRGEISWNAEQIEHFEKVGYVMSGSRHAAMNAMRISKESQVLGKEGRKAQLLKNLNERAKRENEIIAELKQMASTKFKKSTSSSDKSE